MKYRAEIDGLRALAVVPVILFHAGFEVFSGGFVGVDVFFVISGYLITTILIEDIENNRFSIVNFYERRARRILPALFFVMLVCIPFAWMWMLPSQMVDFSQSFIAVSLFASNILFWQESGYFAPAAEEKPLLHTWSLAVEEQYYVLFPIFLILAWRFGKHRVFWMIVVMAAISLLLSEWGWRKTPTANFYLAPTRAWELFAGSIAAFIIQKRGVQKNNALALLGLAAIVFSIFVYDEHTPLPSLYALAPVLGVVLFVLYADKETLAAKLLGSKSFVGIGLISYSAYLWHQPMFAFARIKTFGEPSTLLMLTLSVASIILAYFSWRFVEAPFRKPGEFFFTKKHILILSTTGLCTFICLGLYGQYKEGFTERFDVPTEISSDFRLPMRWDGFCFYSFNDRSLSVDENAVDCHLGESSEASKILLFGDSYAAHWEPFLKAAAQDKKLSIRSVTTNWCFPTLANDYTAPRGHISREQCDLNRSWLKENASDFDTIILSSAWHHVNELDLNLGVYELIDWMVKNTNSAVIVIDTPPQFNRLSVEHALLDTSIKLKLDVQENENAGNFMSGLRERFANETKLHIIDQDDLIFGVDRGYKTAEGFPYSLDGGHISVYGAQRLYQEFSSKDDSIPIIDQLGQ